MIVIPAIDIRNGRVVRLLRGEYDKETVYEEYPLTIAQRWANDGAELIHIVNLDGALTGDLKQISVVKQIVDVLKVKVQFGGGIRSVDNVKTVFDTGVYKVIVGTKAFVDDNFLPIVVKDPQLQDKVDRIIISIDCKKDVSSDEYIVQHTGWTDATDYTAKQALKYLQEMGIKTAVVTDISKDGTLSGPNFQFLEQVLKATTLDIIASGGVSSIEDIENLNILGNKYSNLQGVIIGKALYEGTINLKEAIELCR
ncbi:MAG: 1-(5-phosphoribosyl)-5-[(5-phosphoribosylamino)methylideneamino]imidazole-4-carboxamide isomerase [Candidatus Omnitrophota bacterium]